MANSQDKDSRKKILKFFGLRLLLVAIAIVGLIYAAKKLLPRLFAQNTAMLLLSILIGLALIAGACLGVFFAYKSFQESKVRWKNLGGKKQVYQSSVVIPLAPKEGPNYENQTVQQTSNVVMPLVSQKSTQEPPNNQTDHDSTETQSQNDQSNINNENIKINNNQRAIDFESLKNLDLINSFTSDFNIGVVNIEETSLNDLLDDLEEISGIISHIRSGFINSVDKIKMLSASTISRIGKLLNSDLLFLTTGNGDQNFLDLEKSIQTMNEKISNKKSFEAIFNINYIHYFFVKGSYSENEKQYKFEIDDPIERRKDKSGEYENSDFLNNWIEYVFNQLKTLNVQRNQAADENNKIELSAFFSSNKNKQLAEKECGVFSLEAAGSEYFKKLNLEKGNYNSAFDLANNITFKDDNNFKNSEHYGNYDQFIRDRYLITMALLRESVIKEFVEKKLGLLLEDDRYKNFLNEIREGMIGIHKSFLNKNKDLDFNSDDFQNNLAKYDCEVFQFYIFKVKKIFGNNFTENIRNNRVKNFIQQSIDAINNAIPPNNKVGQIDSLINSNTLRAF